MEWLLYAGGAATAIVAVYAAVSKVGTTVRAMRLTRRSFDAAAIKALQPTFEQLQRDVATIAAEVRMNGGKSLKDQVSRLDEKLDQILARHHVDEERWDGLADQLQVLTLGMWMHHGPPESWRPGKDS